MLHARYHVVWLGDESAREARYQTLMNTLTETLNQTHDRYRGPIYGLHTRADSEAITKDIWDFESQCQQDKRAAAEPSKYQLRQNNSLFV